MKLTRRGFAALAAAAPFAGGIRPAAAAEKVVVLGIDADPPTFNLALSTGYAVGDVGAKIFEGLLWTDRDWNPQPSLATAWTVSPDGKEYRFTLRQGVTWHDGKPFSADDVVFSFDEVLAKFHPRTAGMLKTVGAKVAAPDANTVVITLEKAYAPFLVQMSVFEAPILPKHLYAGTDITTNPANLAPVGTGPFKYLSFARGSAVTLARNTAWWGKAGGIDKLIFQIIPQAANRASSLETGEVDAIVDFYLPKPDEVRLLGDTKLQHRKGINIPAVYFAMFNTSKGVFADKRARQALAHVIDRTRMVAQVMNGLARPGYGAFGDGFGWLLDAADRYDVKYKHDPAEAKALLAAVGYKGETVRLVHDSARPQMRATAAILRDNLRAIGMPLEIVALERAVGLDAVFKKHDFDITLQSYFSAGDPAIGYHRIYETNATGRPFTNASGYSNPEVDKLLAEAATAPDRGHRAELYRKLQAILNEDLPSFVLFDEETADFAAKRLGGLWPAIDARDQWGGVTVAG
jgi:peptide/nickel transport system substrate-binding protein